MEFFMITVNIFSKIPGEVNKFLSHFYNTNLSLDTALSWNKNYANPIEITEIIGTFIDNIDDYSLNMWISLDKGIYLHVTEHNADDIIKYLYERFPY
jgi:hypothetical protein